MMKLLVTLTASAAALALTPAAYAGPFILDGTDADDHGSASGGANQDGWLYIQRGLENLASSSALTRTQKSIAVLGSDPGSQAGNAVQSALGLSSTLTSAGWTLTYVNSAAAITGFFNNSSVYNSTSASLIYMDSGANVDGGISSSEQAAIDSNANAINSFLGSGGALFSHAQGYGWLTTLVPGLVVTPNQDQGITLTAAGQANFPGLTNGDLSAGPFHQYFTNTGSIPILGVSATSSNAPGRAIILGGAGGSTGTITNPTGVVPEPASWAMMIGGFGMIGAAMRRARRGTVVRFV